MLLNYIKQWTIEAPLRFEGIPVVGIEAQSAGLPCLFRMPLDDHSSLASKLPLRLDMWVKNGYVNYS